MEEPNLLRQFGNILRRQKARLNVRIVVFVFFVVVASILWYLNKLSYEYTTEILFPIEYDEVPAGKILVGDPPKRIALTVRGFGYTILKYKLSSKLSTIHINLKGVGLQEIDKQEQKHILITNRSRHLFSGYLSSDLILEKVSPDTLLFQFTHLADRKVPVRPNLEFSLKKQYMAAGSVATKPDSVTITGPKAILDTIHFMSTEAYVFNELAQSYNGNIRLLSFPQVSCSHRFVALHIPVERFTQATLSVPVEIVNQPDSVRLIILPGTVTVKCNVPISHFQNIDASKVRATVDYNDIGEMLNNQLRINLQVNLESISNLSSEPSFVDFFIESLQ